ncbi:hypothetical protein DDB_G0280109 [Dictyostelium discoideum AX4]|uniref:Putative mediator of RNA polymerase II transcription subunit 11 n=1 Tax=Dictyostelium discoideum TaxID=44689 RepID=MED11_DICDI|nr:hypothetical protein DDB_G0280109 [Dictyostelium discoideum AX4]Q54VV8.1 RecName: Full=Putative mediator of RNA polymerase II transcription subunit 11; AltName: Full=Putative mediator complex subunit 11 [Dictyostelium discoideum]EAL67281.1 hypothetical protein DDB_G0280109 [Dictyostelium discoideum AX4]|eukprot:XP_641247.1 hypothetical protein DDB_G0280109 [Dictyostelium discoideum AX4]
MNSLSILNNIEDKVVEAINTAALSLESLSASLDIENTNENFSKFQTQSDKFYNLVKKDIHKGLIDFIDSMTDIAPFDHSSYLKKSELEVSHNFTEIILSHLEDLNNIVENNQEKQEKEKQEKEKLEKEKLEKEKQQSNEMNID